MFTPVGFWTFEISSATPPWTGTYGRWVVVRDSNATANLRAGWSDDGITWNTATTNSYSYRGVDFNPTSGLYVAVASDAVADNIMSSTNGVTWTQRSKPNTKGLQNVRWCSQWNVWLACGVTNVFSSPDGLTWSVVGTHSGTQVVAGGSDAVFDNTSVDGWLWASVVNVNATPDSQLVYTTDGVNFATYSWLQNGLTSGYQLQLNTLSYNPASNTFLATSPYNPGGGLYPRNLIATGSITGSWSSYQDGNTAANVYTSNTGGSATNSTVNRFVRSNAWGTTTTPFRYSSTGQSGGWTNSTMASSLYYPYFTEWAPSINQWLISKYDSNTFYTSIDGGVTWTLRTALARSTNAAWGPGIRTTGWKQGAGIT